MDNTEVIIALISAFGGLGGLATLINTIANLRKSGNNQTEAREVIQNQPTQKNVGGRKLSRRSWYWIGFIALLLTMTSCMCMTLSLAGELAALQGPQVQFVPCQPTYYGWWCP